MLCISSSALRNDELHDLYASPNFMRVVKSKGMRWSGHVACMGKIRNISKRLVKKAEEKRPLGRRGRENNIKMDLTEMGWKGGLRIGIVAGCC
jgi:hypothetical protein